MNTNYQTIPPKIGSFKMSDEEYFKFPALSKSGADDILECPALFIDKHCRPIEDSKALRIGSLFHCMVLEPAETSKRYVICKNGATSKAGIKEREEAASQGLKGVSQEEWDTAAGMTEAISHNARVIQLLTMPGETELAVFWVQDLEDGRTIQAKAKIDKLAQLPNGKLVAIDLKTTSGKVSREDIAKHCATYHYHRQNAWYRRGLEAVDLPVDLFLFVFVSKEAPYFSSCVTLSQRAQDFGMEEMIIAGRRLLDCSETGNWPQYMTEITEIDLPAWSYK